MKILNIRSAAEIVGLQKLQIANFEYQTSISIKNKSKKYLALKLLDFLSEYFES